MYFAWLGFYTNSMLYPAVIGFLLWILAEADQVLEPSSAYNDITDHHCLTVEIHVCR